MYLASKVFVCNLANISIDLIEVVLFLQLFISHSVSNKYSEIYNGAVGREFIHLKVNKLTYNSISDMFIILSGISRWFAVSRIVINPTPSLLILSPAVVVRRIIIAT